MQNLFTITLLSLLMGVVCFEVIKYFSEEEPITKTAGILIFIAAFSAAALSVTYSNHLIPELVFMTFLIITGGIDALTKTVVVLLTGLGAVLLAIGAFMTGLTFLEIVLGGIVGFALYGLIYLVAKAIYKKEAFGFGDVLFMGAIGLFLGPWNTLLAGVLTFYVALVLILVQKVIGKVLNRTSEVAFAPYMAIAAGVVSLFSRSIVELYIKLFMV